MKKFKTISPDYIASVHSALLDSLCSCGEYFFIMENQEEIWKELIGFEGIYEVSNLGRIKSLSIKFSDGRGFFRLKKERIKKQTMYNTGYYMHTLTDGNKRKKMSVHRLIAIHFIPNPENKPCVNHKNGIKTDNRIENLEWSTISENNQHAYDNGLRKKNSFNNWTCKMTIEKLQSIKLDIGNGVSDSNIAIKFGYSKSQISLIRLGKIWNTENINELEN